MNPNGTISQPIADKQDYAEGHAGVLLKGYSYSSQEIYAARDVGQLLCLRMETNHSCNLNCLYCYSCSRRKKQDLQMSFEDARDVVDQAIDMGLRSIQAV